MLLMQMQWENAPSQPEKNKTLSKVPVKAERGRAEESAVPLPKSDPGPAAHSRVHPRLIPLMPKGERDTVSYLANVPALLKTEKGGNDFCIGLQGKISNLCLEFNVPPLQLSGQMKNEIRSRLCNMAPLNIPGGAGLSSESSLPPFSTLSGVLFD